MDASYQVLPSQQTALLETTVAKMREFGFGGKIEDQISWETNKNKFIRNTFYDLGLVYWIIFSLMAFD